MNTSVPLPDDLKRMSLAELQALADDLRQNIVSTCMKNGGHLGASLGAVELAIALHYVFESPKEPLVWDVGHQAYAHKLLTGRRDRFHTLRTTYGISGFLSREESEHDVFGAGHSSTALSAALGMSYARAGSDRWTVAIVGDGGMTAGLAMEALNNTAGLVATHSGPLLLVLNDNQMSISENVGTLSQLFARGRARPFFELFGFEYIGPVDGHDLGTLIGTLQGLRTSPYPGRPIVLHALTQKGKGYIPAEENPSGFHGISPIEYKMQGILDPPKQKTYSEAFGETLCRLAERDSKVVAITAAMPEGTGLSEFARRFPDRFFDVGIAEPHAVTFAAGLATQGFKPVVAIYSTFLQRALDAIIHDVALQRLGVVFAIDRAGLVGADGPTHHGVFDLAFLSMVPHMQISAPACLDDLSRELECALSSGQPWAIRFPRGGGPVRFSELPAGPSGVRWHWLASAPKIIAVALGPACHRLKAAAEKADANRNHVTVVSTIRAKPIPAELLSYLDDHPNAQVIVLEEGVVRGGFGEAVAATLKPRTGFSSFLGYPDAFVPQGSVSILDEELGLSVDKLADRMRQILESADHEKAN